MVFFGAMVALAPSAHAQEKLSLGAGYQFTHFNFPSDLANNVPGVNGNGFFLDLTGGIPQTAGPFNLAWTGELTGNYSGTDGHAYTYTVGGRGLWNRDLVEGKVKPFVDFQIGGVTEGGRSSNSSSDSAFLFWLGGGARFPLMGQKFDVLVKLDYGKAFYNDDHGGKQNIFRAGVGIALPLPLK
jgi:hypothetical protein